MIFSFPETATTSTGTINYLYLNWLLYTCVILGHIQIIPREPRAEGPSVARLINLSAEPKVRAELSRANSSEKYIYIYIYIYISLKMSAMLPSNSKKLSMNDVRQRERC